MPITPFHFGPGTLIKSAAPKWFSLRAFILVQILIDTETLWNIYQDSPRLHTFFHSYLGSLAMMILTGLIIFFYNKGLNTFNLKPSSDYFLHSFKPGPTLTGVAIGGLSHVYLDSIMHADMFPFAPFSNAHPHLRMISLRELHLICLMSFVIGFIVLAVRKSRKNKSIEG